MKTKYLHCSMAGSYHVDCLVLDERNYGLVDSSRDERGQYALKRETKIMYFCFLQDALVEEWVDSDRVITKGKK